MILTYNHEGFISRAIESVLTQETTFEVEIIITEDCSTDRTRDILLRYCDAYPDRIRLLLSERNQNDNQVLTRAIGAARGRYVAVLDGDDYWTSPEKLRKQVEFLDTHADCAICCHNVDVVYDDGALPSHPYYLPEPSYRLSARAPSSISTVADLMSGNFIQTCSVMFRAGLIAYWPDWFDGFMVGDWPLHVLNAEHGNIGYIDEILATYRVHARGLWSSQLSLYPDGMTFERMIGAFDTLDRHFGGRYHERAAGPLADLCANAAHAFLRAGDYERARHYARRSMADLPGLTRLRDRRRVKLLLQSCFPSLYGRLRAMKPYLLSSRPVRS